VFWSVFVTTVAIVSGSVVRTFAGSVAAAVSGNFVETVVGPVNPSSNMIIVILTSTMVILNHPHQNT